MKKYFLYLCITAFSFLLLCPYFTHASNSDFEDGIHFLNSRHFHVPQSKKIISEFTLTEKTTIHLNVDVVTYSAIRSQLVHKETGSTIYRCHHDGQQWPEPTKRITLHPGTYQFILTNIRGGHMGYGPTAIVYSTVTDAHLGDMLAEIDQISKNKELLLSPKIKENLQNIKNVLEIESRNPNCNKGNITKLNHLSYFKVYFNHAKQYLTKCNELNPKQRSFLLKAKLNQIFLQLKKLTHKLGGKY